jgi:hypothetical protein
MTITVTAPNGATVQFPDGTDHDTINSVMTQNFKQAAAAAAPDKYQQAAIDDNAKLQAMGAPDTQGFTRRLVHGATLGADTTLSALATTPAEMIRHGTFDPTEGYSYAKAREDLNLAEARKKTGALGTAAEIAGGGISGAGLASGGVTAARMLAPEAGIVPRALASAADAAGVGGVAGAMEGNGTDRITNAAKGAGVGAALGGLAPFALAGVKAVASPVISNIKARVNPQGYAEGQVARAVQESGRTPNEISLDTIQAGNEGQGAYTLADAMGNPGQRMLSTVARAPGEGRTAVVEALNSRQADQGRRLANTFREGFDAPQSAEQTRAGMVDNANFEAGHNYAPVKRETAPIDVSAPVAIANRGISPAADNLALAQGAVPTDLAARLGIEKSESALRDPIGSALKEARSYLAAPTLTSSNVNHAFRAKTNIDMMISKATDNKQGALVSELVPIRDALDEALANTSSNYAAARDAYRVAQKRINALDLGKELGAKSVRPEDAIRQFQALSSPAEQQAFRVGYADPYVRDAQGAAFGADKTRPLTSEAVQQEFNAFAAPGRADLLNRQIGRERTMFETRHQALGGSKTVDNLNDHEAMGISPELVGFVGHVMHGNIGGALRYALHAGSNLATGNTPAVRKAVSDILLQRGPNMNPAALENMVNQVVARMQHVQRVVANLGRGAAGGVAVEGPGQKRQ